MFSENLKLRKAELDVGETMEILLMWGPGSDQNVLNLRNSISDAAKLAGVKINMIETKMVEIGGREVKSRPIAAQQSLHQEIAHMLARTSAAIAVIGSDDQSDTSRGNVWAEWSFYIAMESDHRLVTVIVSNEDVPRKGFAFEFGAYGPNFRHVKSSEIESAGLGSIADEILSSAVRLASSDQREDAGV